LSRSWQPPSKSWPRLNFRRQLAPMPALGVALGVIIRVHLLGRCQALLDTSLPDAPSIPSSTLVASRWAALPCVTSPARRSRIWDSSGFGTAGVLSWA
jgi:hypothetical protein